MITKKDKITLSVLSGILAALILVFAFAVAPLLKEEPSYTPPPEVWEGEYTNGIALSLYQPITDANLLEITVKNDKGEYAFIQKVDDSGKYSMVIKGHENLAYDNAIYAYLSVFAKDPKVPSGETVLRNLTAAQMAEFGTTELLCKAKVTVRYKDSEGEKTHTLLVGNDVLSSEGGTYVSLAGRDHVYVVNSMFYDNALSKDLNSYIAPSIYTKFKNAQEAAIAIKSFIIRRTNPSGDPINQIILQQEESQIPSQYTVSFNFTFPDVFPQKISASNDYVISVFETLYTNFSGDSVVHINPTEEELEKYGLADNQDQYVIYAGVDEESIDTYVATLFISKEFTEGEGEEAESFHYVLSGYHAEYTVVKISSDKLYFLKDDTETMLGWATTNSVFAGFSEYFRPDPEVYAPGVKVMKIRTRDYNETFYISIDANGRLTAKTQDGKYEFTDDLSAKGYNVNKFSNLYTLLLYYPMPSKYTTLTDEEKKALMTDENIIYELEVELNDGKLRKYTYYSETKGYTGYALCKSSEGVMENGEKKYSATQTVFEVKSRHIGIIADAYKTILEGGNFDPSNYIY